MHLRSAIEIQTFEEHDIPFVSHHPVEYAVEVGQHVLFPVKVRQIPSRQMVYSVFDNHSPLANELIKAICSRLKRMSGLVGKPVI